MTDDDFDRTEQRFKSMTTLSATVPVGPVPGVSIIRADEIVITPTEWIWRNFILRDEQVIVDGPGGIGKSTVAIDLVARTSRGDSMPGDVPSRRDPAPVVIFGSEDSRAMIGARLQAAHADMTRVYLVTSLETPDGGSRAFYLPDDIPMLMKIVIGLGAKFVYFDAIFNHFAPGLLPKNPQDARRVFQPLSDVAHDCKVTILGIRHWGKSVSDASSRALGSSEIEHVARGTISVNRHPDRDGEFVFAPNKANYANDKRSITYKIVSQQVYDPNGRPLSDSEGVPFTVGRIEWGDFVSVSADDLAMAKIDTADEKSTLDATAEFLTQALAQGPRAKDDVLSEAEVRGISARTLHRARNRLKVISSRQGFPAKATWALPVVPELRQHENLGTTGTTGRLGTTVAQLQNTREKSEDTYSCAISSHTRARGHNCAEDEPNVGTTDVAPMISFGNCATCHRDRTIYADTASCADCRST